VSFVYAYRTQAQGGSFVRLALRRDRKYSPARRIHTIQYPQEHAPRMPERTKGT